MCSLVVDNGDHEIYKPSQTTARRERSVVLFTKDPLLTPADTSTRPSSDSMRGFLKLSMRDPSRGSGGSV